MALHTGEAELRDGDYYGAAVNRCARLRAAAHGGQVLLSGATQELVQEALPAGAALRDLGLHRLRDLQRPERIFQLLHPELPADFPPLTSLDTLPNNLPQQVTSVVGREQELAAVRQLLETTRLLTLTGSGGTGKTRLSLQLAAEVLEAYEDGVWLAELAPLTDPALVPQSVAQALGIREEPNRPLTQTLVDALRQRQLLLVLDNCEHLLAACAELADRLLRSCPGVRILASSREGLNVPGELTYRVPSLSLPVEEGVQAFRSSGVHGTSAGSELEHLNTRTPEHLLQYDAVRLFLDRARFHQPRFAITKENAPAVAQVCCRLDGIPLALELAAARLKVMPVERIQERLDDRFRLLLSRAQECNVR
jgi:predicted ATPase